MPMPYGVEILVIIDGREFEEFFCGTQCEYDNVIGYIKMMFGSGYECDRYSVLIWHRESFESVE